MQTAGRIPLLAVVFVLETAVISFSSPSVSAHHFGDHLYVSHRLAFTSIPLFSAGGPAECHFLRLARHRDEPARQKARPAPFALFRREVPDASLSKEEVDDENNLVISRCSLIEGELAVKEDAAEMSSSPRKDLTIVNVLPLEIWAVIVTHFPHHVTRESDLYDSFHSRFLDLC